MTTARPPSARAHYEQKRDDARSALAILRQQHRQMIWIRTVLFFVAAGGLVLGYGGDAFQLPLLTVGWLAALGFFIAIVRHEAVRLAQLSHQSDERLFLQLLARLDRDWDGLPEGSLLPEYAELAYADDLDVGGNASLLSLLSVAGTRPGREHLQRWLSTPPEWSQVRQRQAAVQKLAPERELRLSILKTIRASSDGTENVYGLPQWADGPSWLPEHRVAHWLSYLGPVLVGLGIVLTLQSMGRENASGINIGACILGAGFLLNILVTVFWGSWIHDIFQRVTGEHRAIYQFADVFAALRNLPSDDGLLQRIRSTTTEGPHCAQAGFARLKWIVRLANFQRDPTLYVVYLALQLLFLWDFRILKMLEKWKAEFQGHVTDWFIELGTCEALMCGAMLADEYSEWSFPEPPIEDNRPISVHALGHPLLADQVRVANDLQLDSTHPLLLVTGSNMAGKSTFMRALGLNVLLARTGSPVCAAQFACPLYELATSIRVRDSLRDGVSFFMAELRRLKEVVDLAQQHAPSHRPEGKAPLLFLLDEVLQGTNSRERQIAVASVLDKLLASGAIGLVSTHDLDLAAAPQICSVSQIVHFREHFETENGREVMRFDYRMYPGPTPTTNALKLLSLVGLDAEQPS